MTTTPERNAAFDAVQSLIVSKIKAEVPGMFMNTALSEVPSHRKDILDIANAALDAAEKARVTNPTT
jgi:hypothetical protein